MLLLEWRWIRQLTNMDRCSVSFRQESKICIINGRITPAYDTYMFIFSRGKAVVDYFATPVDNISNCKQIKVYTARWLVDEHCNLPEVDINIAGWIPDHSALVLTVHTGFTDSMCDSVSSNINMNSPTTDTLNDNNIADLKDKFHRWYNIELDKCILGLKKSSRSVWSHFGMKNHRFCSMYYVKKINVS